MAIIMMMVRRRMSSTHTEEVKVQDCGSVSCLATTTIEDSVAAARE